MDQIEDPQELKRKIERANLLASVVGDRPPISASFNLLMS